MADRDSYVFVSQRYPPEKGGNASRIRDLAVNVADDASVTVLAPPACYPPGNFERSWERCETERRDGVVVHRLWSWQPRVENPGLARRLPYYLLFALHATLWLAWHHRSTDAVLTSTPPITTGIPGLAAAFLGTPWVVDVRDLWIDNSVALGYVDADSPLVRASRWFQGLVLGTADRITVTTQSLGTAVTEKYGAALDDRIRHLPNGVDTTLFEPTTERDEPAPDRSETADTRPDDEAEPPVVVYTGNLGSAQPLEPCIRAMDELSHDATLRFVGDGDERSRLEALTERLGLADRVEFVGLVDREAVPAHINGAAVGLAPIKDTSELAYAMPTKAYEYLACGVPLVVTGRGEVRRFVEDSGGGRHAEVDPAAIAEELDALLDSPERRRRLGTAGREHVVEAYDRANIADRLEDLLSSLAGADDAEVASETRAVRA
ncbi:glycosyltransferase family 4 protein [Haloarcula onubensis]|uniref:Glycosyltransferase family 4 protein n=1 Tax=Haloarcula onubensis TaxID=2950539 RepID=A0ABU2FMR2_9EURY|nr:glycosyltransferase family 4 protein [Halomicroarcula sp. S3CR25-11]MDS0281582.1 glycosyltransferase family 4 protein [Halomicroarcula sp. S3CR25-11]